MAKAKITTRTLSSSTATSDQIPKSSGLTTAELDSNFLELQNASFGVAADDSATIQVAAGDTLYIQGGTNVTTTTNSDGSVTINSTAANDVFKNIAVAGQSNVSADSSTDTVTFVAGSNMSITTDAGSDTVTFASTASGGGGSSSTGNITFNASTIGISSANRPMIMTAQGSDSSTDGDNNTIEFKFKNIQYHNTNVFHKIGDGGNLKFQSTSGTPFITLYEFDDDGRIELQAKATQPVLIEGVHINDNTISTAESNANLEISANGSGKVSISGLSFPTSDGSNGQALVTNGSGVLSFSSISGDTLGDLTATGSTLASPSNADITLDPGGTGKVNINGAYKLPNTDGSADQVLGTNGSGVLSFVNASAINIDGGTAASTYGAITAIDGGTA